MKNQKIRSMKVHEQSGYNYKATPTIILKGQWLKEMGFEIGDYITVSCEDGKLVITPDAENHRYGQVHEHQQGHSYDFAVGSVTESIVRPIFLTIPWYTSMRMDPDIWKQDLREYRSL